MVDLIKTVSNTPIPVILIVAGIVFLFFAMAEKVYGEITIRGGQRKHAKGIGIFLLLLGVGTQFAPIVLEAKIPNQNTDWRKDAKWKLNVRLKPSFSCMTQSKLKKDDSRPQSELICIYQYLADADREMGDYYNELRKAAQPADRVAIKTDQKKWLTTRDINCPVSWQDIENAPTADVKAKCLLEQSKERTSYFKDELKKLAPEN